MIHGIISILITLTVFVLSIEVRKWFINRKLRHFESPSHLPIIGCIGRFIWKRNDEIIGKALELFNEVKTPFQAWFGPILVIGVAEPKDIQIILTNEQCLNKPQFYEMFHCKSSIIVIDKEIWKSDRRALNTAFNVKMLQNYVPLLNEKSHILLEKLQLFLHEPGDLYRTIFICMMDMVTRTTMGTDMNMQSDRGLFFYKIAKQIMHNVMYRIPRLYLWWDFMWFYISKVGRDERIPLKNGNVLFDEMYDKRVHELALLQSKGVNYLNEMKEKNAMNLLERCLLMEKEGLFTHDKVLDQMRVIILAGIDTSSITVFGTLLMLAINPKHQEIVVDELRSVFESADCDVAHTHLANMKYTELVIKESMRLLPPVPFIGRTSSADIHLPKGTLPKGATIVLNIMHLHRNPEIWGENVLDFEPDRFLPENAAKRPPFSYIPFSGGPRNCIGMKYAMVSAKITLAHLLRRYKFTTHLRFDQIRINTHLVTEVTNDKPLRVEQRIF